MSRFVSAVVAVVFVAGIGVWPARADSGDKVVHPPEVVAPFAIKHPLPFKFGERLKFDVKFSRFPIYANVGEVTFAVMQPVGSDSHVKFEVAAVSRGALLSLFGVKVNDVFTTLADRNDFFVYSTIKNINENDERQHEEAVFDRQAARVRWRSSNLTDPTDPGAAVERETKAWVQDVVSAIYFARTRKLNKVNREVHFPVSDRGETYDIGVALVGRERVKVDAGTFDAIKVEGRIFNGRLVRRSGEMYVWFTDDDRRIPVKAVVKTDRGTVTFDLHTLDEGSQPITPTRKAPVAVIDDDE